MHAWTSRATVLTYSVAADKKTWFVDAVVIYVTGSELKKESTIHTLSGNDRGTNCVSYLQFCQGFRPFLLDWDLVLFDAVWHTKHNIAGLTAASGLHCHSVGRPSRGKQISRLFLHSGPEKISSHCLDWKKVQLVSKESMTRLARKSLQ